MSNNHFWTLNFLLQLHLLFQGRTTELTDLKAETFHCATKFLKIPSWPSEPKNGLLQFLDNVALNAHLRGKHVNWRQAASNYWYIDLIPFYLLISWGLKEHSQLKVGKEKWTQVNRKRWLCWKNLKFRISKQNSCPLGSLSFQNNLWLALFW